MHPSTLLITGINGFLAQEVLLQLSADWRPIGLVRPNSFVSTHLNHIYDSVDKIISNFGCIDVVLHLAACIPFPSTLEPAELMSVNVGLVEELIKAYPNARHVLASSVSVYGTPTSLPLNINSPHCNPSPYGLSKLSAEKLVRRVSNHAIIRFSSIIGAGMRPNSFIPAIISASQKGAIILAGDGKRLQNYLDVKVAARICLRAVASQESFTALGIGEKSYSNNEVAAILAEFTGASITHIGSDDSPSFVYQLSDGMRLGHPYISLRESLKKMVVKI